MSTVFWVGFMSGFLMAITCVMFVLSKKSYSSIAADTSMTNDQNKNDEDKNVIRNMDEKHIEAETKVIDEALELLNHHLKTKYDKTDVKQYLIQNSDNPISLPALNDSNHVTSRGQEDNVNNPPKAGIYISAERLEKCFNDLSKESKDREKQIKNIVFLFTDIGKSFNISARELAKAVQQSYNNGVMKSDVDFVWERWWSSIFKTVHSVSLDHESLYDILSNDIVVSLSKIQDEYSAASKHISSEGIALVNSLRQNQTIVETCTRDRDRCRVAFDTIMTQTQFASTNLNSTGSGQNNSNHQTVGNIYDNPKVASKLKYLQISENALLDATERLQAAESNFNKYMPKWIANFLASAFKTNQDCKTQILKFVHSLNNIHGHNSILCQTLKAEILSVFSIAGSKLATSSSVVSAVLTEANREMAGFTSEWSTALNSLNLHLQQHNQSQKLQQQKELLTAAPALDVVPTSESGRGSIEMVDLKEQRTNKSSLAFTAQVDAKDQAEERTVQSSKTIESSNWPKLDMHSEAISTLAACSPLLLPTLPESFRHCVGSESAVWFNALLGRMYRDVRSSLFFRYWVVAKATYLFNKSHRPEYVDEFVIDNITFGTLPPLLLNIRWIPSTCTPTSGPAATTTPATATAGSANASSASASASSSSTPPPVSNDGPEKNEYDVEFTADFVFRSGVEIKISTRLWLNWPRDRYASIPVALTVEMSELSGNLRFGVDKTSAWLSFVDEPFSRIKVKTEFGEHFKLKDVPKLSTWMTKKLKESIRNKLVYPNKHRLRLPWPRFWWPSHDGPDLFIPSKLPILPIFQALDPKIQHYVELNNDLVLLQFGDITKAAIKATKMPSAVVTDKSQEVADSNNASVKSQSKQKTKISKNVKDVSNKFSIWWVKKFRPAVEEEGREEGSSGSGSSNTLEKKWQDVVAINNRRMQKFVSDQNETINKINAKKRRGSFDTVAIELASERDQRQDPSLEESSRYLPVVNQRLLRASSLNVGSVSAGTWSTTTGGTAAAAGSGGGDKDSNSSCLSSLSPVHRSWSVGDLRSEQLELMGASSYHRHSKHIPATFLTDTTGTSDSITDLSSSSHHADAVSQNRPRSASQLANNSVKMQSPSMGGVDNIRNAAATTADDSPRGGGSAAALAGVGPNGASNAAAKAKVHLDWISKLAKDKFQKLKSSNLTVDSLSEVFLGNADSNSGSSTQPHDVTSNSSSSDHVMRGSPPTKSAVDNGGDNYNNNSNNTFNMSSSHSSALVRRPASTASSEEDGLTLPDELYSSQRSAPRTEDNTNINIRRLNSTPSSFSSSPPSTAVKSSGGVDRINNNNNNNNSNSNSVMSVNNNGVNIAPLDVFARLKTQATDRGKSLLKVFENATKQT